MDAFRILSQTTNCQHSQTFSSLVFQPIVALYLQKKNSIFHFHFLFQTLKSHPIQKRFESLGLDIQLFWLSLIIFQSLQTRFSVIELLRVKFLGRNATVIRHAPWVQIFQFCFCLFHIYFFHRFMIFHQRWMLWWFHIHIMIILISQLLSFSMPDMEAMFDGLFHLVWVFLFGFSSFFAFFTWHFFSQLIGSHVPDVRTLSS